MVANIFGDYGHVLTPATVPGISKLVGAISASGALAGSLTLTKSIAPNWLNSLRVMTPTQFCLFRDFGLALRLQVAQESLPSKHSQAHSTLSLA